MKNAWFWISSILLVLVVLAAGGAVLLAMLRIMTGQA